jgi:hypothetical protein
MLIPNAIRICARKEERRKDKIVRKTEKNKKDRGARNVCCAVVASAVSRLQAAVFKPECNRYQT